MLKETLLCSSSTSQLTSLQMAEHCLVTASLQAVGVSNRNEPQRGNLSSGLHFCISEKGMRTTVRETERSAELPAAAALLGAGRKHLNTSGIICCINLWDFFLCMKYQRATYTEILDAVEVLTRSQKSGL